MEPITIGTEAQALQAVEEWKKEPVQVQRKNIRLAIESLELSQIYYEQKGNKQGARRSVRCIAILKAHADGIKRG
ncbi:hypothetical protein [Desulfolithobacter sp.]